MTDLNQVTETIDALEPLNDADHDLNIQLIRTQMIELRDEVAQRRVEFSILRSHINRWAANGRQLTPSGIFHIVDGARPFPDEVAKGFEQ